ncbi:MAG: hypothetical protein HY973_00380 [Candidatus Kerfeldbacteria bacterium]|nr:hypothetical protein [Candidatus Kerfeldbacteria bacterium]
MKKNFIYVAIVPLFFIFLGLFLVSPVWAASCKCYETNSDGSYSNNIKIDGVYCKEVSTDKCYIDQFKDENGKVLKAKSCISIATQPEVCYSRVCQPYLDNQCQKPFGEDKSASVNKCWTEDECNNADGVFDKDGKRSPNCTPLGDKQTARCFVKPPKIKLQVPIPGLSQEFSGGFPEYLAYFYKFFVGFMAVVAVVMIMWGGFKRIMAAGNAENVKNANGTIFAAIIGLVLTLVSYTLLNLINPKLVELTGLDLDKIRTEQFGSWCPEKDPIYKTDIKCGYVTTIDGNQCVGKVCPFQGKGCYEVNSSKEVDASGKSKDYECLTPAEACESITKSVAESVHGDNGGKYGIYDSTCRKFSKNGNICAWAQEYGTVYYSTCRLFTPSDIIKQCAAISSCSDLNNTFSLGGTVLSSLGAIFGGKAVTSAVSGNNFALCNRDLCKKDCVTRRYSVNVPHGLTVPAAVLQALGIDIINPTISVGGMWVCEGK